jgi:dTMP kinase
MTGLQQPCLFVACVQLACFYDSFRRFFEEMAGAGAGQWWGVMDQIQSQPPPEGFPGAANPYPGMLIALEGIDGAGKNTQIELLRAWLLHEGMESHYTPWKPSKLIRTAIKHGKRECILSPLSFALLAAADFADRLAQSLLPPLQAGYIVLADGYATGMVCRDIARGLEPDYAGKLYAFAPRADVAFYLRTSVEEAREMANVEKNVLSGIAGAAYAMPGSSREPEERFRRYQEQLAQTFEQNVRGHRLTTIDSAQTVEQQQRRMRQAIRALLSQGKGVRGMPHAMKGGA